MKKFIVLIALAVTIPSFAQLNFSQKARMMDVKVGLISLEHMTYIIYSEAKTKKDRQGVINWMDKELSSETGLRFQITKERIRGLFEKSIGNYNAARSHFNDAIRLFESSNFQIIKSDKKSIGSSVLEIYEDLADLFLDMGNLEKSKEYYNKSRSLKLNYVKKGHDLLISTSTGLAYILMKEGDYERAVDLYNEIYKSMLTFGAQLQGNAFFDVLYNLGHINLQLKDYKKATYYFNLARNNNSTKGINVNIFGNNLLNKSMAEVKLGQTEIFKGNFSKAKNWIDKSELTFMKRHSRDLNEFTEILKVKAKLSLINNDFSETLKYLEEMMDNHIGFLNNNFYSLSELEKEKFFNTVTEDLNLYFDLSINIFNQTKDPQILKNIINRRIQTKGFILNDQNKIKQAIMSGGDEALKSELEDWQQSKEALAFYLFEEPDSPSIDSLNLIINRLERSLSEKTRLLSSTREKVTDQHIRNLLEEVETAVEIIRYTSEEDELVRYAAIVMKKGSQDYRLVVNTINEVDETRFSKYYKSAIQFETRDENTYASLWESIDRELNGAKTVFLSPDGIYHQVNINTIPNASGQYMIDKYQVINMTNLKDLANKASGEYASTAYLFGRPQYDYTQDMSDLFASPDDGMMRSNLFMELENFQEQEFADLPGTQAEIISISGTLKNYNWSTESYSGPLATEQQVKSLDNPGIMHIATHGFFLEATGNVNPMIKSGLVMAGVNNKGETMDDGVLTAYEATNLKLDNTWLVVLSACETGLGDIKNGEGVYGLQRALTVAGASNLMMTLWKVDDTATKELMINFYDQLGKGVELEEAFRNSQIQLRKKYPHPKYWGSFVLVKAKT